MTIKKLARWAALSLAACAPLAAEAEMMAYVDLGSAGGEEACLTSADAAFRKFEAEHRPIHDIARTELGVSGHGLAHNEYDATILCIPMTDSDAAGEHHALAVMYGGLKNPQFTAGTTELLARFFSEDLAGLKAQVASNPNTLDGEWHGGAFGAKALGDRMDPIECMARAQGTLFGMVKRLESARLDQAFVAFDINGYENYEAMIACPVMSDGRARPVAVMHETFINKRREGDFTPNALMQIVAITITNNWNAQ